MPIKCTITQYVSWVWVTYTSCQTTWVSLVTFHYVMKHDQECSRIISNQHRYIVSANKKSLILITELLRELLSERVTVWVSEWHGRTQKCSRIKKYLNSSHRQTAKLSPPDITLDISGFGWVRPCHSLSYLVIKIRDFSLADTIDSTVLIGWHNLSLGWHVHVHVQY